DRRPGGGPGPRRHGRPRVPEAPRRGRRQGAAPRELTGATATPPAGLAVERRPRPPRSVTRSGRRQRGVSFPRRGGRLCLADASIPPPVPAILRATKVAVRGAGRSHAAR